MKTALLACIAVSAVFAQKDALLFHASFDKGLDADVAKGDRRIYTAPNYKEQNLAKPGLDHPDVSIVKGGKRGDALQFRRKNTRAVFYKADKNTAFDPKNWSGTFSFWLSLDPETDLEPGFCDPIQVTDAAHNDSAIWVDFTKDEKPRHFRLGVFGDRDSWDPKKLPGDKNPAFNNRLVAVKKHPFAKGQVDARGDYAHGAGFGQRYGDAVPERRKAGRCDGDRGYVFVGPGAGGVASGSELRWIVR